MKNETLKKLYDFVKLVFKALATAMGVAVVALSVMGRIDTATAITFLGIGVAGSGVALLMSKKNEG